MYFCSILLISIKILFIKLFIVELLYSYYDNLVKIYFKAYMFNFVCLLIIWLRNSLFIKFCDKCN